MWNFTFIKIILLWNLLPKRKFNFQRFKQRNFCWVSIYYIILMIDIESSTLGYRIFSHLLLLQCPSLPSCIYIYIYIYCLCIMWIKSSFSIKLYMVYIRLLPSDGY